MATRRGRRNQQGSQTRSPGRAAAAGGSSATGWPLGEPHPVATHDAGMTAVRWQPLQLLARNVAHVKAAPCTKRSGQEGPVCFCRAGARDRLLTASHIGHGVLLHARRRLPCLPDNAMPPIGWHMSVRRCLPFNAHACFACVRRCPINVAGLPGHRQHRHGPAGWCPGTHMLLLPASHGWPAGLLVCAAVPAAAEPAPLSSASASPFCITCTSCERRCRASRGQPTCLPTRSPAPHAPPAAAYRRNRLPLRLLPWPAHPQVHCSPRRGGWRGAGP